MSIIGDIVNAPGKGIAAAIGSVLDVLKGAGIIRTQEDELRAQQALATIEQGKWQTLVDFVRATTPSPERVYVWVNSLIALIRPLVTIALVVNVIWFPEHRIDFSDARVAPVMWWFFGPEALQTYKLLRAPVAGNGQAAAAPIRGSSSTLSEAMDRGTRR